MLDDDAIEKDVKSILTGVLNLVGADMWDPTTQLLGSVPEFDSMAVVGVITGIEEHFGVEIEDDDVSAETFETVGSLIEFVRDKVSQC